MDPYIILNLKEDVDDATIKEAYLSSIRSYPPEQYPEMFEAIRSAYETIATEINRQKYLLFQQKPADIISVICACLENNHITTSSRTISEEFFRQVLKKSAYDTIEERLRGLK